MIIEPLAACHADVLTGLLDERVNRHFAMEDVSASRPELRKQFEDIQAAARDRRDGTRFLPFVVKTIADGQYIGRLKALVHGNDAEIAFVFFSKSWGKGFATEVTCASILHLKEKSVEHFWASVPPPSNGASLALCRRLHFARSERPSELALAT